MSETPRTKASQAFNPTINASSLEGMLAALFDITIPEVNEAITRLERELAAERERADRNQEDAERYRWILHQAPITDFIFVFTKSKERHVSNAIDAVRRK